MDKLKKKFVVYTALFGDYDELSDPAEGFDDCDFICFTDQKDLKSKVWKTIYITETDMPPKMMNRKYKMLPHLFLVKYEESLYIDSNVIIKKNPLDFRNKYLKEYDMVVPVHFRRKCLYEEANEVLKLGLADKDLVLKQIHSYMKEGFPKKFGLTENNLIYRKHKNPIIIKFMEEWWKEYLKYPTRDQLSFMYVLWRNSSLNENLNIGFVSNIRGSEFFRLKPHKNRKKGGIKGLLLNKKKEFLMNYPNSYISKLYSKIRNAIKNVHNEANK